MPTEEWRNKYQISQITYSSIFVVIFEDHYLPEKKIPSIQAKATSLSAKTMELKNGEEWEIIESMCFSRNTSSQSTSNPLRKVFIYCFKSIREECCTPLDPIQCPLCLLSHTRNVFNSIKQPMLLPWVLDVCLQKQTIHL